MEENWKIKIPLSQTEDTYLSIRTMKSDIETFQKTGEVVPEIIMRKDIEASIPKVVSSGRKILSVLLYIFFGAAILFFLYSLLIYFSLM